MNIYKAKVEKLLITQPYGDTPKEVSKLELLLDGIKYDRHFGKTRNADVRTSKILPKGIEITNLRSITIISKEELDAISNEIGFEVLSEDLEANITLSGIKNLTSLSPATFIRFPKSAIIYITGENLPCVIPAQNMIKRGMDKTKAISFSKIAMGKRGLTAIPFASGIIKTGDGVEIIPTQNFE